MSTITLTEVGPSRDSSVYELRSFNRSKGIPSLTPIQSRAQHGESEDIKSTLPPPTTAVETVQRWNSPRSNIKGVGATFISFLVLGLNDASPGALIPYLEKYYGLTYTVVSLIFLSPFVGYSAAALLNNSIHMRFGQRGIAIITPLCHLITYIVLSCHPPYPVLVVFFVVAGFGNGLADAGWCAYTGSMASANKVQGFLQSFYSLGATLSPLIATSMIVHGHLEWYTWYYVMCGVACVELAACTWAFWHKDGARFRIDNPRTTTAEGGRTKEAIKNKVTWLCALFFLGYVGAEVALGGWIVTFMINVRKASKYSSGLSATGFWAGMTVGRVVLGFVTERFGERLCVFIYLAICLGLELIFWLVPTFVVSAVAVALLGFFMGPLFPAGIVACAKLLPRHLHVSALGFATAIGGTGGAIFPYAVGAIAQAKGVKVLQPIIMALLVVISLLWLSLTRVKKVREV